MSLILSYVLFHLARFLCVLTRAETSKDLGVEQVNEKVVSLFRVDLLYVTTILYITQISSLQYTFVLTCESSEA